VASDKNNSCNLGGNKHRPPEYTDIIQPRYFKYETSHIILHGYTTVDIRNNYQITFILGNRLVPGKSLHVYDVSNTWNFTSFPHKFTTTARMQKMVMNWPYGNSFLLFGRIYSHHDIATKLAINENHK
jgi:hypothetical protein